MDSTADQSNISNICHKEEQNKALVEGAVVFMIFYCLIFILGVTGNGLVIFITGFRMKKTVNSIWFLSLAIADFTFILFLPLRVASLAQVQNEHFNTYMCKFYTTIALLNHYASVYHLMIIGIDRCISVRCPVWAKNYRTPRLASSVVVGVWILSLLLCSPNPFFRETKQHNGTGVPVCCLKFHSDPGINKNIHQAVIICRFISGFLIPFSVIIFCYGALVLRLRRSWLSLSSKPFKVITVVIVVFFVLCFPAFVVAFLEAKFDNHSPGLHISVHLTYTLVYFNSCLNPILYFFMGRDSKESLKRSLLSAFENALAEESNFNATHTKSSLSTELESQNF